MELTEAQKKKLEEKWENLDLSNDFLFGKIMSDPQNCKELLQRIFPNMKIKQIWYIDRQKTIDEDSEAKGIRLDLHVKDNKNQVYNIEMQVDNTGELPKRSRYYGSLTDINMLNKGQYYRELRPYYIIFITRFDPFKEGRHIYTFRSICKEDRKLELRDGATKIFLNTKGKQNDINKPLKAFLDYLEGKITDDPYIQQIDAAVKRAKQKREWRRQYMMWEMRDMDNQWKGRQAGLKMGRKKGRLEGREEQAKKTVNECYKMGLSIEQISKAVGYSEEKVKKWLGLVSA